MNKFYAAAIDAVVQIFDAVHVIESRLNFIENCYPYCVRENSFDAIYNKLAKICSDTSGLERQIHLLNSMDKKSLTVLIHLINLCLKVEDKSSVTRELTVFKEIAEELIKIK